ncbi:hypothetical protein [Mycobacterium paragordonae]|uniref:hypothetical protein n=1 Tax=Mycobacterium paragordonae TaxID=1389713 RepID=UPI0018CBF6CE|nr:hypothetical protein [Mycobacterium paragordonae]
MAGRALFAIMWVAVFAMTGCSGSGDKPARQTPTGHDNPSRLPPIYPGTTVSFPPSTESSSSSPTTTSSSAPVSRTIPGDGTFRTGVDLVPGTYRSQGGDSCYWERLRGFGGQTADIIANGAGILPQTVTIAPTDAGFRSQGCAPWTLMTDGASTTTTTTTTTTTSVALPAGAQACPSTSGPSGGFAHSAVGSADTSCPFAEQVRVAYGAGGPASVTPRQVEADSPVTGQRYTMTCAANGSMVVCNGGNGAVVYVY